MVLDKLLMLGDPRLYEQCTPLSPADDALITQTVAELHAVLMAFRDKYKAGRAIAAPQIGVMKRLVYMHIDRPFVFINPSLHDLSEEMIELWDDCMCFPNLLVRLRRHQSCLIRYYDTEWQAQTWRLEGDLSELLQHEVDHLDGVLAISRALDDKAFRWRG